METTTATEQGQKALSNRLLSIDALRGFDMMFIMGIAWFITTLCHVWPGTFSDAIAQQMTHPDWNGLTHHDTIFPLFLFIAGMTFPFSWASHKAKGWSDGKMYRKVAYRVVMLIFLGLVYGGIFRWEFASQRYASVLGRIGIAWGIAAIIYMNVNTLGRAAIAAFILIAYALVSALVGAPDVPGADPLSFEGCFAGYVDRHLVPGRLYRGTFDPEGLFSCIPAVVTAMLGMFTGEFVRNPKFSGNRKTCYLVLAGVAMLVTGLAISPVIPLNKNLWSTSFVLVVGAYSVLMFALFYYLIDVRGWKKWAFFFEVIGMNSITIYLAQRIFDFSTISDFFVSGFATHCLPETWQPVVLSGAAFVVSWLFLYFLYRQKIFLKI